MRAVELFAGAGGAALGLEAAGVGHAALVEWDADACATLRAAGLGPVIEGDVRELGRIVEAVGPEPVDLLWSSFPCQAWSIAGARKGAADERNGWPWTVAAVDLLKPTWLLAENVRGLTQHKKGCLYRNGQEPMFHTAPEACPGCYLERRILDDLRRRFAFAGFWLLDAADYGVPQHRRRVIIWAGPAPLAPPAPTHGPGCPKPWVSMGEALGIRPSERVWGGGHNPPAGQGHRRTYRDLTDEPSTTVAAVQIGNAGPFVVAAGETGQGTPRPMHRAAPTIGTKGTAYLLRPAPTVTTTEHSGVHSHGAGRGPRSASEALVRATRLAAPAPTVCVGKRDGIGGSHHRKVVEQALDRRRLTVAECATLQDFPAEHPWQGTKTAQYRQVGNAVPPTLARVVGELVVEAERRRLAGAA